MIQEVIHKKGRARRRSQISVAVYRGSLDPRVRASNWPDLIAYRVHVSTSIWPGVPLTVLVGVGADVEEVIMEAKALGTMERSTRRIVAEMAITKIAELEAGL